MNTYFYCDLMDSFKQVINFSNFTKDSTTINFDDCTLESQTKFLKNTYNLEN